MLKTIVTNFVISSILATGYAANVVDGGQPITGKHDGRNLNKLGTAYANTIAANAKQSNLIDNDAETAIDTFNPKCTKSYSYFGVLWPRHIVSEITELSIVMKIFKDGGWFGKNNFLPTNKVLSIDEAISKNSQPIVQITNDLGKSWKTVKTKSNYLTRVKNHQIKEIPTFIDSITFEVQEPISDINGIRIIGSEGGMTSADKNGFVALSDFKVDGIKNTIEITDGNVALMGRPIMGIHSGRGIDKLGTVYHNEINPTFNIIDGDLKTFCDSWKPTPKEKELPYSFVGLIWDKPLTETISRLEVTFNTHYDGGWFGKNYSSPEQGSMLNTNHIAETSVPMLQVTQDKGKSWQIIRNKNNYLTKMIGHKIGNEITPSTVSVDFTAELELNNIDGIRLIGPEGGGVLGSGKDANGFLSIAEFKVLTSENESEISSGVKYSLVNNEFSWEVENEGWIKEYRVINSKTNETILITPAVEADIYSINIATGVIPKLQIVDKYDKVHDAE